LADHRFRESGVAPATPRTAATVILLRAAAAGEPAPDAPAPDAPARDAPPVLGAVSLGGASLGGPPHAGPAPADLVGADFEVYLQRRVPTMAFAPRMYVFPGGSVDPRDAERELGWAGPSPQEWAGRLGLSATAAKAVVCAAVREVFEECGVLLAGPDATEVIGDVSGADWEASRVALLGREVNLADLLADRGLVIRSDLLAPYARWITPMFEPRRFDTYFFLARLPEDQIARDVGGEADLGRWLRPADAADLPMLPPTAYQLADLAATASVDAAFIAGQERDLSAGVLPRIVSDATGTWFVLSTDR
jgi:8-oxo-dGTP pyrophosphatase MutT (NUDIX family)